MSRMNRRVPLPVLGPEEPKRSPAPKILVFVLVIGGAGGWWWWHKHRSPAAKPASEPSLVAVTATPASVLPAAAVPDPLKQSGLQKVSLTLQGPLESALVESLGTELGQTLAQVIGRTLVWWVPVPGGLMRGDRLDVLFETRRNEEPIVHALRFNSGKRGQTYAVYRFKPPGAMFARYYLPSGDELEMRLRDAPLDDYEQVTSLIRDGRRHKGVDFKTPVGSKVRATFDGVVTRKNWHFRANGNCLEVTERGGAHRRALFLHLSPLPKSLQLGTVVKKGEVIASSGNSGHSFAPHLHYQLMLGETRLLDPFISHPTYRQSIAPAQKTAFEAETHRLDVLMPVAVAGK
jgi:murein DD-endopeptidase